jgi:hypothetical protein
VTVTFTGTQALLKVRPTPYGLTPPQGEVSGSAISTVLEEGPQHSSAEVLQGRRDHWLGELQKYSEPLRANVEAQRSAAYCGRTGSGRTG